MREGWQGPPKVGAKHQAKRSPEQPDPERALGEVSGARPNSQTLVLASKSKFLFRK
jgi:hypothetical protein